MGACWGSYARKNSEQFFDLSKGTLPVSSVFFLVSTSSVEKQKKKPHFLIPTLDSGFTFRVENKMHK
jgi:hypothetical protein